MIKIPLTQGKFALIDDEDYSIVNLFKWYAHKGYHSHNAFYATTNVVLDNKKSTLKMHRLIANVPFNKEADHKDRNGLNNQKYNLRICTDSQNQMNSKSYAGSSKFKGVSWYKITKRWTARITLNRKLIYLGYFKKEKDAAKAYNNKAKELYGEFARLNNI